MQIIQHLTPYATRARVRRPPLGIVLHNTVTLLLPQPTANGSWHFAVDRDGTCHQYVHADASGHDYAWHVRACDEWRPSWMEQRDRRVSEPNSCTVGIELVSFKGHPQCPANYVPYTDEQYATLQTLLAQCEVWWGPLPIVTHGALQLDRTDPVGFVPRRASLYWDDAFEGYQYLPVQEEPVSPEDQAILDKMHALNANADSIDVWINQIGALESEVARLTSELDACEAAASELPAVAPRVVVQHSTGREDGYVPET